MSEKGHNRDMNYKAALSHNESKVQIRLDIMKLFDKWVTNTSGELATISLPSHCWDMERYFHQRLMMKKRRGNILCFEKDKRTRDAGQEIAKVLDQYDSKVHVEMMGFEKYEYGGRTWYSDTLKERAYRFDVVDDSCSRFFYADFCGYLSPKLLSDLKHLVSGDIVAFTFSSGLRNPNK